ncbi:hypothetical protein HNR61_003072 [Actinomadura namibiensis]|uniref:Uncharacterized protein n=1 Tax=Actinomadura namibiensis TaxID=182080 RepID=A0A7W3LNK6_ACTNM|nr:hypothetical protein [Actinomadura namibiensis]
MPTDVGAASGVRTSAITQPRPVRAKVNRWRDR